MRSAMVAILVAVLGGAVAVRPAPAGDGDPARIERLEAENAVLRLEVRALRDRVQALEEIVRLRLAAPGGGAETAGRLVADDRLFQSAKLTPAGDDLDVPGLPPDSGDGAATPEDLVRLLHGALAESSDEGVVHRILLDLSAFGNAAFFVPASLWDSIAPAGFPGLPTRDELAEVLGIVRAELQGSHLTSLTVRQARGPIAVLETRATKLGVSADFALTTVRVNGRWFLAHLRAGFPEREARAFLLRIRGWQERLPKPVGTFDEIEATLKPSELRQHRRPDARTVELPFYRVELNGAGEGEYSVVATPRSPSYPTLIMGPLPGETAPDGAPYNIRTRQRFRAMNETGGR